METNFNLSSLKTIQTPLLDSLNGAHENVKKNISIFVDDKKIPTDYSSVETMVELEKIYKMIGLHSLAIIFNLNGEALRKVKDIDFDTETSIKILHAVEKILENAKNYVKSLINGAVDHPTKFFDDYQALATLIRKDVSIKDLFNPRLELKENVPSTIKDELRRGVVISANNKKNILENLKVIETVYLTRLLDFKKMLSNNGNFSSEDEKERYQLACKNVYEKFDVAQKLKISKPHYILFGLCKFYVCIISPVLNEKFNEYVTKNKSNIEENLEDFRKVIVNLTKDIEEISENSKTGVLKPSDTVVKDILYSIIKAVQENSTLMGLKVYAELSTYFNLEAYSEQLIDTKMQSVQASKLNFNNIDKWFAELKEDFTLINSKKKGTPENFKQHIVKLLSLSNKLAEGVMSVKEVHVLISQVAATLAQIRSGNIQMTEAVERELSIALVLIEYGVNNIIKSHVEGKYRNEFGVQAQVEVARIKLAEENKLAELASYHMPKLDSLSQKADERKSFAKIFEQVSLDLATVEETLDLIINKKSDGLQTLEQSVRSLQEMRGIFSVIGKLDLVPALEAATNVWKKVNKIPDEITDEIRESIVIISGISLFVKSLRSENESEAEEIYENIIKRYKTGLFKPEETEEAIVEIGAIEAESFEDAGVKIEVQPIIEFKKEKRSKDEVIDEFNNALNSDTSNLTLLVSEYLDVLGVEKKVFDIALALIGISLAINTELENKLEVSKIQDILDVENLGIQFKNKSLSTASKNMIKAYAELLGSKEITKLSAESHEFHNQAENVLSGLFSHAALVNLPEFESVREEPVEVENIKINNNELKVYVESTNDEELGEIFMEEATEVLEILNDGILNLANGFDNAVFVEVRRQFHTLKGSGRMVGLNFWGEAAWMTEQTLNRVLSNELPWSNEIYLAMKDMKERFNKWLAELKSSNSINVDLVSVKIMWQGLNDKLTNHVDIVIPEILAQVDVPSIEPVMSELPSISLVEETVEPALEVETEIQLELSEDSEDVSNIETLEIEIGEVIKEEEESPDPEYININGKEVSYSLYKLYKEESVANINNLKVFAHQNYDNVRLDDDFMRYAHTLASISKTVNLQKIASIAVVLEDIAFFTGEREVNLNAEQMNIVRHAVDSLELFQNINSTTDVSFYENILKKTTDLYELLVESVEEEKEVAEVSVNEELPSAAVSITNEEIEAMVNKQVEERLIVITEGLEAKQREALEKIEREVVANAAKAVEEKVSIVAKEIEAKYAGKVKELNVQAGNAKEEAVKTFAEKESALVKMYEETIKSLKETFDESVKKFKVIEDNLKSEVRGLTEKLSDKDKKPTLWEKLFGKK